MAFAVVLRTLIRSGTPILGVIDNGQDARSTL